MDKPVTTSVKAWIIRNISVRNGMKESTIETIVNHQFESALSALDTKDSLEFSGFGKFFFNRPKALKKMEKFKSQLREFDRILDDPSYTETRKRNIGLKKEVTVKNFNYLNRKLNEHSTDLRGVEKPSVSPEEVKGNDSGCSEGENGGV